MQHWWRVERLETPRHWWSLKVVRERRVNTALQWCTVRITPIQFQPLAGVSSWLMKCKIKIWTILHHILSFSAPCCQDAVSFYTFLSS